MSSLEQHVLEILPLVSRPGRYLGGEVNSVIKSPEKVSVRVALAFPDTYEIGMSHLGLQILYSVLNRQEGVWAERTYAPWTDMEARMRAHGLPLYTLESFTPLCKLDMVGFSLQSELSYTNILNMLDLGEIPIWSSDRGDSDPLVIGGGPCAFNPEPLANFFDAFLIGEGEEAILEIVDVIRATKGLPREERLKALGEIEGVYVPSLYETMLTPEGMVIPVGERVTKRLIEDMDRTPYPTDYLVPFVKPIHDRVTMEVFRGCMRGCRFCQAGMIYRPVRERSLETISRTIDQAVRTSGAEEVCLASLASCDYSQAYRLVEQTIETVGPQNISVSLPSLRIDNFSVKMAGLVQSVKKTGLTFAPEAGSLRLRRVINKPVPDETILNTTLEVYASGWDLIKLYFMVGLPTETKEDVRGIAEMACEVLRRGKKVNRRAQLNVGISTFVPKPHTPFQWEEQIDIRTIEERQRHLSDLMPMQGLHFKWHDARKSFLEGVLARGDRRIGKLIYEAYRMGCKFDGWWDTLHFSRWQEAAGRADVHMEDYLRARGHDEALPWDHIDCLVQKEFLLHEHRKALQALPTEDCRWGQCQQCGMIGSYKELCRDMKKTSYLGAIEEARRHALNQSGLQLLQAEPVWGKHAGEGDAPAYDAKEDEPLKHGNPRRWQSPAVQRIRFRMKKSGKLRFLSHLEFMDAVMRAMRRAGILMAFSQGYSPHPRLAFADALPVGIASQAECGDIGLSAGLDPQEFMRRVNRQMPEGLRILEACEVGLDATSLSKIIGASRYQVFVPADIAGMDVDVCQQKMALMLSVDQLLIDRAQKGNTRRINIRPLIYECSIREAPGGLEVEMLLADSPKGKGHPGEVLHFLFEWRDPSETALLTIEKTGSYLNVDGIWQPFAPGGQSS